MQDVLLYHGVKIFMKAKNKKSQTLKNIKSTHFEFVSSLRNFHSVGGKNKKMLTLAFDAIRATSPILHFSF